MGRVVIWGATDRMYTVECIDPATGEEVEVYHAGNSFGDSHGYVEPENGVGLAKMREWAEQTAQEMAEEYGAEYEESKDLTESIREMFRALEEGRL